MNLTPDQLNQIKSLGIQVKSRKPTSILPLLSISGLTFLSFGGLILLKSKSTPTISTSFEIRDLPSDILPTPTQVPKSIQHYLLTSQQFFTQALQQQNSKCAPPDNCSQITVNLINQSIISASTAIKTFPSDSRAYEQRGRIYISLLDSQPQLISTAIADLSQASILNPNSAEITRTLAALFARKGDVNNTLAYLTKTITIDPTNAQNFYDLAHLQQQIGQLPAALDTYNRLLTIVADPSQKAEVVTEKSALEKLISQSPGKILNSPTPFISPQFPSEDGESPLLQASLPAVVGSTGLIIAAPATPKDISVTNLSTSNSLSGTSTLPANIQKVSITNSNLTPISQVYLTITKGGKNLVLQVLGKSQDSFIVGLDSATNEDIEFKWWIIN